MILNKREVVSADRWGQYERESFSHKWSIAEGAVRSGKTVANCQCFADRILMCEYPGEALFLGCAVSESMAKALIGECSGFGLYHRINRLKWAKAEYCKYKDRDALRITARVRGRDLIRWVLFVGGAKARCDEAIRGLTIQGAMMVEANLFEESFILEVERRMIVAEDPFIYADMNPSMSKHFIYRDFIDNPKIDLNYCHATLIDNPALSPKQIEDISNRYDKDSVEYKGFILGERMNPAGAIYRIHEWNVIEAFNPSDYDSYVVVCDQGKTISATAMTLGAVRYDKDKGFYTFDVLKEYHHINSGEEGEKHFEQYASDFADFLLESSKVMGSMPVEAIIDEDSEFYHQCALAFQKKGIDPYIIKYPYKLEIVERIRRGTDMLHKGQLRFLKDCEKTIEDFKNAEYDEKEIEKRGEFVRAKKYVPGFGHLDMVDSVEYGFTRFLSLLDPEY